MIPERQLTKAMAQLCHNRGADEVLAACLNIIVNCLRQNYGRRAEVEAQMNELFGRGMTALMEHYDPATGRRRSVVPFDQVIRPALFETQDTIMGGAPLAPKGNGST
jgi:hypothetical protein